MVTRYGRRRIDDISATCPTELSWRGADAHRDGAFCLDTARSDRAISSTPATSAIVASARMTVTIHPKAGTSAPALLGITAGRGVPVAGYDTGLLLGRSPVLPHWLVLVAAEPAIGLVFEHFDGYQQISNGSTGDRRLLEMPALIDAVTRLTRHRSPSQELRP